MDHQGEIRKSGAVQPALEYRNSVSKISTILRPGTTLWVPLFRMPLVVKQNEAPDRLHVGVVGTQAVMIETNPIPHLIQQSPFRHDSLQDVFGFSFRVC